jgi:hypothetical protein
MIMTVDLPLPPSIAVRSPRPYARTSAFASALVWFALLCFAFASLGLACCSVVRGGGGAGGAAEKSEELEEREARERVLVCCTSDDL